MIFRPSDFLFPDHKARLYPETPDLPWHLEVGFGDGRFWVQQAQAEPANYLGVEISGVSLLKAEKKLQDAGLKNAILTRLHADPLIQGVVPEHGLDRIYVNFPDPWPKHEHNRLLQVPFFEMVSSRLKPDGEIWFTTDHEEYFQFALEQARQSGLFELIECAPPAAALQTKYALKWQDLGFDVYHVRFRVKAFKTIAPYQVFTEDDMPHSILVAGDSLNLSDFQKTVYRYQNRTIILLEVFQNLRHQGHVFLAHIEEEHLTQEILVQVTPREDGTTLVKTAKFGNPLITEGVKLAVRSVTEYLKDRGYQVTHTAY
ncbi:tRNA (guanosine(46)-N7)-methyltransferase TrmB [Deinococcus roseus]|uniref:tRNA (guanine-N(7)-)-methyltransferase n=1 Tax=Deinococcus roseus TaxID=392414 RepID=A0ABQ2D1Q8_9DEIO|nr:tRNA (guanosine(46)-N7)-methyltransferase TrmB [Deinococcus roseus]GGJ42091.1 tRNA (guanine-N(7)-)-methyltransferase [Deinococcus roseus]